MRIPEWDEIIRPVVDQPDADELASLPGDVYQIVRLCGRAQFLGESVKILEWLLFNSGTDIARRPVV